MNWLLGNKGCTTKDITRIEDKFSIVLPKEFVELVLKSDSAYPEKESYDLPNQKEKVVQNVITCKDEKMNVDEAVKIVNIDKTIPFMNDPFGNYLCFQYKDTEEYSVVLWNHEDNSLDFVANSFGEFLKKLY